MNCFRKIRKYYKKTQQQVADYIGINRVAYTNYENDKREPDIKTLIKIADYFSVTLDELVGRSFHSTPLIEFSNDELELIKKYRALDEHGKNLVNTVLDCEYGRTKEKLDKSSKKTSA